MAEIYCWSYLKLAWPKHQGIHRGRNRSQNLDDWYIEQLGFCISNSYDYYFRTSIYNDKYVLFTSITLKIKTLYYSIEISSTIFKYILISCSKDSTILSLFLPFFCIIVQKEIPVDFWYFLFSSLQEEYSFFISFFPFWTNNQFFQWLAYFSFSVWIRIHKGHFSI